MTDDSEQRFDDAEIRYSELRNGYLDGDLSAEELRAQVEQIRVQDDKGRWWSIDNETSDMYSVDWQYYDGSTWIKAVRPGQRFSSMREDPRETALLEKRKSEQQERERRWWRRIFG